MSDHGHNSSSPSSSSSKGVEAVKGLLVWVIFLPLAVLGHSLYSSAEADKAKAQGERVVKQRELPTLKALIGPDGKTHAITHSITVGPKPAVPHVFREEGELIEVYFTNPGSNSAKVGYNDLNQVGVYVLLPGESEWRGDPGGPEGDFEAPLVPSNKPVYILGQAKGQTLTLFSLH